MMTMRKLDINTGHILLANKQDKIMRILIVIYALFISAYCAPMFDEQLNNQWTFFKLNYKKQYVSIEEENTRYIRESFLIHYVYLYFSRTIWEANLAKIHQHNLEADTGIHSYRLGMNQFGDMVKYFIDKL